MKQKYWIILTVGWWLVSEIFWLFTYLLSPVSCLLRNNPPPHPPCPGPSVCWSEVSARPPASRPGRCWGGSRWSGGGSSRQAGRWSDKSPGRSSNPEGCYQQGRSDGDPGEQAGYQRGRPELRYNYQILVNVRDGEVDWTISWAAACQFLCQAE